MIYKTIKEKLMPAPRIFHLPNMTDLYCIGIDFLDGDILVYNFIALEEQQ